SETVSDCVGQLFSGSGSKPGRSEIDSQELRYIGHRRTTQNVGPARNAGFLQVAGTDQAERPKSRPVGKDVVVALALGVAPDLIRRRPPFLLLAEHLVRFSVLGVDPAPVRPPSG